MAIEIIVGLVLIGVVFFVIIVYNLLITAKQRVNNAWSQIDVQLKKRADLVYNLVEMVKGYAKHEKDAFVSVTEKRSRILASSNQKEVIDESNVLIGSLKSIFAVVEDYPNLKANENFLDLQRQLVSIENDIARARMIYNDVITIYNTQVLTFPYNILANMFGFKELKQLEADDIARAPVQVKI